MSYNLYAQIASFSTRLTMNTMDFLMKAGSVKKFDKGTLISKEGQQSDHVYIIVDGVAGIEKVDSMGSKIQIGVVESGGVIGEMGVFLNMKRSASIVAYTTLSLIEFTNEDFINALPKTPDLTVKLLQSLTTKVDSINQRFTDVTFQNTMFTIGVYILDQDCCQEEQKVTFNPKLVSQETGIEYHKIVAGLRSMLKQGLISQWTFDAQKMIHFNVKISALKAFLKTLPTLSSPKDTTP